MVENKNNHIDVLAYEFIIFPGKYRYKNKLIKAEGGLLRICDIPHENHNRLIWDGDLFSFLSGLTWIHSNGHRDNGKSYQESLEICKKRQIN